jgi:hypothetical protein
LFSLDLVRVAVPLALLLTFAASVDALEFAYYTSLRNDSRKSIEVTPDVIDGRSLHYTVQPGRTVTFLGGFSTERFMIRTSKHVLDYKFPLTFGAKPAPYKGRRRHSYVFTGDSMIYPLDPDGQIVHTARGFPLVSRSR